VAHVVVVGAGLAGARTCAELRASGFDGHLLLVGAEPDEPYDRPPLTKDPGAEVDLSTVMGLNVHALADEVRLGTAASRLRPSPDGLRLDLSDGPVRADAVVVATGADPVLPAGWAGPGVHVLHTRRDAAGLWAQVRSGTRLEVVGGGWIGCEAAATAASRGARVRLREAADQLLPAKVPPQVAQRVHGWLADSGVEVHVAAPVHAVASDPRAPTVSVAGSTGAADLVLVGLGVRPSTAWLAGSGLAVSGSGAVLTDAWGRAGVPGVAAVGDAAARWSARSGRHLVAGHWTEALNAPSALAPALAGWLSGGADPQAWRADPGPGPHDPVPYVFSEIGGRTLQVLGDAGPQAPTDAVVWRESGSGWSAFRVDAEGRLLGVASSGRPRDVAMVRRLLADAGPEGIRVDRGALADPDAPPDRIWMTAAVLGAEG
jgi:3-phenylpropionate/trans-cinnamate dioxygenase ferredoxin reductase component